MKEDHLDAERDRMIAAFCGELSPEEMRDFEAALEVDEALRRDWDDLLAARGFLGRAKPEEAEAGYGFSFPGGRKPDEEGSEGRFASRLRHRLLAAAAGFAAAAAIFVAFLLGGLRIDRTPQGLLVRFDRTTSGESETAPLSGPPSAARLQGEEAGVTRGELAALTQMLVEITSSRMEQFEQRQAAEQEILVQGLYEALSRRQERHYEDLGAKVELAAYRTAALLGSQLSHRSAPAQRPSIPMTKEQ